MAGPQVIARIKALLAGGTVPPLPNLMPPLPVGNDLLARFIVEAEAVGAVIHRTQTPQAVFGDAAVADAVGADQPLPEDATEPELAITRPQFMIADTGTLVEIYRPGQERNASVLAATHAALTGDATLVSDLASFYSLYRPTLGSGPELVVFITGPSRTADIEQTLVMGAHGPKALHIFIDDAAG